MVGAMKTLRSGSLSDPMPGDVIGNRFRLIAEVSRDEISTLFTAQHLLLNVVVDVRILERALAHLAREVFAGACDAGLLRSGHVCRVIDVGLTVIGVPYVVLQHAPGSPLAPVTTIEDSMRLASQAKCALAEAHAAGLVHGGITREHLRVEDRTDGPFLRIVGFELARLRVTAYLGKNAAQVDVDALRRLLPL
jgi:hypothetical protein